MTSPAVANTPDTSVFHLPQERPRKSIIIRSYREEDQKAAARLFQEGMNAYASVEGESKPHWADYIQHSLRTDLADIDGTYFAPGGHFWVATTVDDGDEVVVGTVGAEVKPNKELELRRMSVHSGYRRDGIGRLLISTLEDWAKENGYTRVWLSTAGVAEQAHRFYRSMGYTHYKTDPCPHFPLRYVEKNIH